jgi:hypothetical protein
MIGQDFEASYSGMSDGELAKALRDRRDLTPEAKKALDLEIQKRGLDPMQLHQLRPHSIDKPWQRTRLGRFSKKIGIEEMRTKRIRGVRLVGLIALSFFFAATLDHFGILEWYWPIFTTAGIALFTVWGHLELAGRPWFWMTIAFVIAAHVAFFYFLGWPWGNKWVPAATIAGFWSIDLFVVFALIWFIEKQLHEDRPDGRPT